MSNSSKITPTGYFRYKQEAEQDSLRERGLIEAQRQVVSTLARLNRGLRSAKHPLQIKPDLSHLRHNDAAFWSLIVAERADTSNRYDRYGYHTQGRDKSSPIFRRKSSPVQHALVETRSVLDISQEQWAAYLGVHWTTLYRAEAWNTGWPQSPHVDKLINLDYVRSALYWLLVVFPGANPSSPTHEHIPAAKHHLSHYVWCRTHKVPYRIGIRSESIQDQLNDDYQRESIAIARNEEKNRILGLQGKPKPRYGLRREPGA